MCLRKGESLEQRECYRNFQRQRKSEAQNQSCRNAGEKSYNFVENKVYARLQESNRWRTCFKKPTPSNENRLISTKIEKRREIGKGSEGGLVGCFLLSDGYFYKSKKNHRKMRPHSLSHSRFGFRPTGSKLIRTARSLLPNPATVFGPENTKRKKIKWTERSTNSYNDAVLIWNDLAWLILHRPHKTGCSTIDGACSLAIAGDRRRTFPCRCESQASPWEIMAVCCNLAAKRNQRANAGKKKPGVSCWSQGCGYLLGGAGQDYDHYLGSAGWWVWNYTSSCDCISYNITAGVLYLASLNSSLAQDFIRHSCSNRIKWLMVFPLAATSLQDVVPIYFFIEL